MSNKPPALKKGWVNVSQANDNHPIAVGAKQTVEVMTADGDTRIGDADSFAWGWNADEESRIVQYRILSTYAKMTADELLAFISANKDAISEQEKALAESKIQHRTAMNELNRRLQDTCDVTLNEVMNTGATPR